MDCKSLMIGDWVTILRCRENDSDRNARINAIGKGCILAPRMPQDEMGCYPYDYKKIAPIPLTAEILEKNGFMDIDTLGVEACCGYNIYYKSGEGYGFNEVDITRPFYYVHELQHALRLCGLNELADNFRV